MHNVLGMDTPCGITRRKIAMLMSQMDYPRARLRPFPPTPSSLSGHPFPPPSLLRSKGFIL